VYGLIRQESRFIMDARSGVGASGLMQVMPATARWTAKKIGLTGFTPDQLNDRDTNITIGTAYLKLALDDFAGSEPVHGLFMEPVAPPRWWLQGANRSRAGGPARICNAADAAWAGQPFGQGSKTPHSALPALSRPPAWPAACALIAAFCCLAGSMKRSMNRL
jgi:hypothetical protein